MATQIATQSDIDRSQELQDRGIRKEFLNVRPYMDKHFEQIDERFEEQQSYMDKRFEQMA
jgi:hypothetical protein